MTRPKKNVVIDVGSEFKNRARKSIEASIRINLLEHIWIGIGLDVESNIWDDIWTSIWDSVQEHSWKGRR